MLDPIEIGIFTALGVAFAAGLLFLALWGKQNPLRVSAYALIAVAFLYVGFAFRSLDPNSWVAVEMTGVAIFGSLAYMSIIFSPWFLVVGLALHPLWAIVFHYNGSGAAFTPGPFALANAGFDVRAGALRGLCDPATRQDQDPRRPSRKTIANPRRGKAQ